MWSTTINTQNNLESVIEIMNSMKRGDAPVKDLEVSTYGSNDHKINRRYDKPRNGVCPSMLTHKNQEVE